MSRNARPSQWREMCSPSYIVSNTQSSAAKVRNFFLLHTHRHTSSLPLSLPLVFLESGGLYSYHDISLLCFCSITVKYNYGGGLNDLVQFNPVFLILICLFVFLIVYLAVCLSLCVSVCTRKVLSIATRSGDEGGGAFHSTFFTASVFFPLKSFIYFPLQQIVT